MQLRRSLGAGDPLIVRGNVHFCAHKPVTCTDILAFLQAFVRSALASGVRRRILLSGITLPRIRRPHRMLAPSELSAKAPGEPTARSSPAQCESHTFESLLAVARLEALIALRQLLHASEVTPAQARERRMAATAILRLEFTSNQAAPAPRSPQPTRPISVAPATPRAPTETALPAMEHRASDGRSQSTASFAARAAPPIAGATPVALLRRRAGAARDTS